MRRVAIDRRMAALAPFIMGALKHFRLRRPRRVRPMTREEADEENHIGFLDVDLELQVLPAPHSALPLITLAHELAHLKHWNHTKAHLILAMRILEWWQTEMNADRLPALPKGWRN